MTSEETHVEQVPTAPPDTFRVRTYLVLGICGITTLVALAIAGLSLDFRFQATNAARANNARVWHAVVCSIENTVIKQSSLSVTKKVQAVKFYDDLLVNDVHTLPCGLEVKK